jgi:hypothetical protein
MKRLNGKRGLLRAAALGQVLLLVVAGCKSPGEKGVSEEAVRQALAGKDGDRTVNAANTIVNGYSALTGTPGANQVTVNAIGDFAAGGRPALAVGDLVLITQMQGADITTPDTAAYGAVTYNNAGNYEFAGVAAIAGNTITLACNRQKAYTAAGNAQVIRVPQYGTLTVTGAGSITAPAWNGTVGGVVAVQAATTLQLNGNIDVTGTGFRGGVADNVSALATTDVTHYRSAADADGAEKGESIAGPAASLVNGGIGRGAPANGGGGGNSHNGGGGGGANAGTPASWTGQGVMLATVTGAPAAWVLELGTGVPLATSSGGGRGGYTYSSIKNNATTVAPGNGAWGGNNRRERGGLGGHPLTSSPGGRLFLGGGGGAGDGNNGFSGSGGPGGGLVFVVAGTVQGAGTIRADGANGGPANSGNSASGDAPGGGGGGGTVVVRAAVLSEISVEANGGVGGIQTINSAAEAEGPGGGGGGGYVSLSGTMPAGGTAVAVSVKGGVGGTTNTTIPTPPATRLASAVSEFPSNGATAGYDGVTETFAVANDNILYCTSPNTVIATSPTNPTTAAAGDFTFTSPQSGVTFECSLDGALPFTSCAGAAGAYTTPALNNGPHTIDVQARDINGNVDATPAHYAWTVTAPVALDTTIGSAPATLTNVAAATFTFTSVPTTGVTFQCSLDGSDAGPWATCTATYTTTALTNGMHVIYVRARDAVGNVDPTPASYTWTVDLTRPDTTIVTNPDNPTNSPTGSFTFSGSDAGGGAVTFECRIDTTTTWTACSSPYTTPALTDGTHTLYVHAVDLAGNVDATPATYTWVVHLLGLDGSVVDTAVPDSAVIDTAVVIVDSAVPDTRPDSAVPDLPIVVSPDVRLDSPVADRAPDLVPDASAVGIPDAEADGGLGDALADVGGRDAVAKDTQVFPVVDSRPIDTTAPNPVPDAEIVVDTAVPVVPVPDAAVGPGPQEPQYNLKVMGAGFCAVNPMPNSAPGLFTFFLVAAFGLLVSRRRR